MLNLIELLKANSKAGIAGQTFEQVDGTAAGTKMTDYRVTGITAAGWESSLESPYGNSVNDYGTEGYFDMPPLTVSVTRGSKASIIQQKTAAAFTASHFVVYSPSGGGGSSVQLTGASTSDDGGTFQVDCRVTPVVRGSPTFSRPQTFIESNWWYWTAVVGTSGTVGSYSTLSLLLGYDPDSAVFNPQVYLESGLGFQGYNFNVYDRTWKSSDFEFRWYATAANPNDPSDTTPYVAGSVYAVVDAVPQTMYTVYLYARYVTGGGWFGAGLASYYYSGTGGGGGGNEL